MRRNLVGVWLRRLLGWSGRFFWIVCLWFTAQFFINSLLFAFSLLTRSWFDLHLSSSIPLLLGCHLRTFLKLALAHTILISLFACSIRHLLVVFSCSHRLRSSGLLWLLFLICLLLLLGRLLHGILAFAGIGIWSAGYSTVGLLFAILCFSWWCWHLDLLH